MIVDPIRQASKARKSKNLSFLIPILVHFLQEYYNCSEWRSHSCPLDPFPYPHCTLTRSSTCLQLIAVSSTEWHIGFYVDLLNWGTYNSKALSGWVCSQTPLEKPHIYYHVHIKGEQNIRTGHVLCFVLFCFPRNLGYYVGIFNNYSILAQNSWWNPLQK